MTHLTNVCTKFTKDHISKHWILHQVYKLLYELFEFVLVIRGGSLEYKGIPDLYQILVSITLYWWISLKISTLSILTSISTLCHSILALCTNSSRSKSGHMRAVRMRMFGKFFVCIRKSIVVASIDDPSTSTESRSLPSLAWVSFDHRGQRIGFVGSSIHGYRNGSCSGLVTSLQRNQARTAFDTPREKEGFFNITVLKSYILSRMYRHVYIRLMWSSGDNCSKSVVLTVYDPKRSTKLGFGRGLDILDKWTQKTKRMEMCWDLIFGCC